MCYKSLMAWQTIRATEDQVVELWPAGDAASEPLLKIRSIGTEDAVVVYLEQVRHLVGALADAATQLAEAEVGRHD